jgi:hypothetical protein
VSTVRDKSSRKIGSNSLLNYVILHTQWLNIAGNPSESTVLPILVVVRPVLVPFSIFVVLLSIFTLKPPIFKPLDFILWMILSLSNCCIIFRLINLMKSTSIDQVGWFAVHPSGSWRICSHPCQDHPRCKLGWNEWLSFWGSLINNWCLMRQMKACADANGYRADFCFFSTAIVERRILIEYTFIFFPPLPWWKDEFLSSKLLLFPHCCSGKANCYLVDFCFFPLPWCGKVHQLP